MLCSMCPQYLVHCALLFSWSGWDEKHSTAMADNKKLLEHFESENRESVEPVEEGLRAQVEAGECVAIRGERLLYH